MTLAVSVLALVALAGAGVSIATYVRTRTVRRAVERRAEGLYRSALALEVATDRALASIASADRPVVDGPDLDEDTRRMVTLQAVCEVEFAAPLIAFSRWDPAQARRVVELARGTGALNDDDVDYLDTTRRLSDEIMHDVPMKRKVLAAF